MFLAPTVHCTLPFGNDVCSVELLGSVVLEQHGYESDYDAKRRKFLCKQRLWWLDTELQLNIETWNLLGDSKTKQMHRQQGKSKKLLQLCMFFSKLQLVCIWAPATRREVCPRLLQSMLVKTLHTKYNLRNLPPNLRDSKYPIFPLQQKSNKSQPKDPQWYQHRDQLSLGYDTGVWTADEVKFPCVGQRGSECSPEMQ